MPRTCRATSLNQRDRVDRLDSDRARVRVPPPTLCALLVPRPLAVADLRAGLASAADRGADRAALRVSGSSECSTRSPGWILVYLALTLPLSIVMATCDFRRMPIELGEAAVIDGASHIGILLRIMLPLSLAGVVVIVLYAFVATWNEFIFALSFATDTSVKTLPIGLAEFSTEYDTDWGAVMAASVIMTLPIAIMFFGLQKLFVGGLISGGVKG